MTLATYLPAEVRAAMPSSDGQPLPLHWRADFQPILNRGRPSQLLDGPDNLAKPLPPERRFQLQYRYLDNNETVVVPNIWYNQTVEMRLKHWAFEVRVFVAKVADAQADLDAALANKERSYHNTPIAHHRLSMAEYLRQTEENLAKCQQIMLAVAQGERFL